VYGLDGDKIRKGLNCDLDFSPESRQENIRRVGEVGKLFVDAGFIVISSFISPYEEDRLLARKLMLDGEFVEVFVDCPLAVCEARDPKGLYRRARSGEITNFTGIDSPYEKPEDPEIKVDTSQLSVDECVGEIITYLNRVQGCEI